MSKVLLVIVQTEKSKRHIFCWHGMEDENRSVNEGRLLNLGVGRAWNFLLMACFLCEI